jgi:uncharacterized protein YjbI with pentapeptide repeats
MRLYGSATGRVIRMRLLLLAFGLFSAALVLPDESIFAADPNHVAQLRATKKCVRCDLREADLKGADLTGADLTGADLTGARLNSANLTGAKLNWAI